MLICLCVLVVVLRANRKKKKTKKKKKKRSNTRENILKLGKRRALLISESDAHKTEFHLTRQDMTGP